MAICMICNPRCTSLTSLGVTTEDGLLAQYNITGIAAFAQEYADQGKLLYFAPTQWHLVYCLYDRTMINY